MKDLHNLEKILKVEFKNQNLLRQALTHRSYLNEHPEVDWPHNERLEFLGDAVIELIVTEYLFNHYDNPEGDLTSWRASLVNSQMLAQVANELHFNDFLLLSKGEAKDIGKTRQYIMANTFEAILGAIYLDQGFDVCRDFLNRFLLPYLSEIIEKKLYRDPKSLFQEEAQDRVGITPTYEVIKEWGPDHARQFVIGVFLGDKKIAEGEGFSKQEAQKNSAAEALKKKKWNG